MRGCRGLGRGQAGVREAIAVRRRLCGMKLRQDPSLAISSVSKTLPLGDKDERVLTATSHNGGHSYLSVKFNFKKFKDGTEIDLASIRSAYVTIFLKNQH